MGYYEYTRDECTREGVRWTWEDGEDWRRRRGQLASGRGFWRSLSSVGAPFVGSHEVLAKLLSNERKSSRFRSLDQELKTEADEPRPAKGRSRRTGLPLLGPFFSLRLNRWTRSWVGQFPIPPQARPSPASARLSLAARVREQLEHLLGVL